jgi:hypothetical protein
MLAFLCSCGARRPEPVQVNEKMPRKVHVFVVAPGELVGDSLARPSQLRALALPSRLPLVDVDAVIAPEGDRASALTLEPIFAVTGLTPEASAHEQAALVDQIRDHHQQTVLVIAHPLEMPALVAALGVPADELGALEGDLVEVRVDGTSAKARAVPLD